MGRCELASIVSLLRRQMAGVAAVVLLIGLHQLAQLPTATAGEVDEMAEGFAFTPYSIALPSGYPTQTVRDVNQDFEHLEGWVSAGGAAAAINDLSGDGVANDLCITDPRIDQVAVTPAPNADPDRYEPFVLDPGRLPMDHTMAPMGCVPGDFNADSRTDLLVYYWGRTPIIFLARADATELSPDAYLPQEMVSGVSDGGDYTGPQWSTCAITVSDLDGDGHEDIVVGNYWPHGPLLDETTSGGVQMPRSLSNALNGGASYIYRWTGGTAGPEPTVTYEEAVGALKPEWANGWVLASAAADLDGDLLPEVYLAHDFGRDRLLHNRSTPGKIQFVEVDGAREPMVPKSKVLGHSSFKGMGVDFADLNGDGLYDILVSNITTSFGLQESNFSFINTAADQSELRESLADGRAPFEDRSASLGLAWVGWAWDIKAADLNNDGRVEVLQTNGFVKGKVNRWPQLQEMATSNDELLSNPFFWPNVREGDDISGDQRMAVFAPDGEGRYVDLGEALGVGLPVPSRGVALGDSDEDGRLDFAIARQWDEPMFYENNSPSTGEFLGLRLIHDTGSGTELSEATDTLPASGSPVVGAQVRVTTADGRTLVGRVDGGSGHSGKRSSDVFIGLGHEVAGPLSVHIAWRDRDGNVHEGDVGLTPGWHSLRLGTQIEEES
jgi:hypothetical protein